MKRIHGKLARRVTVGFILAGIILGLITVLTSYQSFYTSISRQYQETAYMVADTVSTYITVDDLEYYVKIAKSQDMDKIRETEESKKYLAIWQKIENLRTSMQLNDIYIVYYTAEEMRAYDGVKEDWQPLHYVFDCLPAEADGWLGATTSMNPKNRELFAEVPETGQKQKKPIISNGDFGYNMTGLRPVTERDGGDVIAIIGVEIPMRRLQSEMRMFAIRTFGITILGIMLIMILIVSHLNKSVVLPVIGIAEEVKIFGETGNKVSEELPKIKTGDEIEMLAKSIVDMEHGIIAYVDDIARVTAEKERIGTELQVATQIQADMLPQIFPAFPGRDEFDVYAIMDPAKEVGGDFYDFFLVDDDHLALVIADVSGKGVPAALFMVIAKTLIKNKAQTGVVSPSVICEEVNNQLCEGNEAALFVTVWLAILEISTGKGIAANAGHEDPALRRKDGTWELVSYDHDLPLATMEELPFEEHEFQLYPGDTLYVYTDGVPEATNASDELYGTDRMVECLNRSQSTTLKGLLDDVCEDVAKFVGDAQQFDDMTMLGFYYDGPGAVK